MKRIALPLLLALLVLCSCAPEAGGESTKPETGETAAAVSADLSGLPGSAPPGQTIPSGDGGPEGSPAGAGEKGKTGAAGEEEKPAAGAPEENTPTAYKPAQADDPARPPDEESGEEKSDTVTIGIVCADQTILEATAVGIEEGDTVFDVLKSVTRENKIHLDFTGSNGTAYVTGIGNIYEFDQGAESGWIYKVNGDFPAGGCASYQLHCGDVIEWLYTKDMGRDLGRIFE